MKKHAYLICVFNVYRDMPQPFETREETERRMATTHYVGLTKDEVYQMVYSRFRRSCDWHWTIPTCIGWFPTKMVDGYEMFEAAMKCPYCGQEF